MNYKDTKKAMMDAYPTLYANEVDVLHTLFFLIGNGYEWKNGELVDGSKTVAAAIKISMDDNRKFIKRQIKFYQERKTTEALFDFNKHQLNHYKNELKKTYEKNYAKNERRREIKRRFRIIDEGMAGNCWFLNKDGGLGLVLYSMCEYAKILHVPNDVKPDWLAAAKKALVAAKTMRKTPGDVKWLNIARDHLRAIVKDGSLDRPPAFF